MCEFWLRFHWSVFPRIQLIKNNIPALVQIMAWRRPGDKPLSETMMVSLLTHICVTRPQCVKSTLIIYVENGRLNIKISSSNKLVQIDLKKIWYVTIQYFKDIKPSCAETRIFWVRIMRLLMSWLQIPPGHSYGIEYVGSRALTPCTT